MTKWEAAMANWKTAKPRIVWLVVGLAAGPVLTNYFGLQQTIGSAQAQTRAGVVGAHAQHCVARARADVANAGKLDWNARSDLAKKWSVLPGASASDADVARLCTDRLVE